MPTINIEGVGKVTVDDTFLQMPPEEQSAFVDEVVSKHGSKAPAAPTPQPAPVATPQKPKSRSISDEVMRQIGLTGRAGIEGLTKAFSFPVNAVGSAAAGTAYQLGFPNAARYIESNFGMEGGAKAASVLPDLNNMPKPENETEKKVQGVTQAMAGGTIGNVLQGATGALPEATNAGTQLVRSVLPSTESGAGLAVNTGLSAGMEYAPKTTLGSTGAVLAYPLLKKGGAAVVNGTKGLVDDALQSAANESFGKGNPYGKVDAEIITDLSKIKKSLNPTGKGNVTLQAEDLNGLANTYLNDLRMKLKAAGIENNDIEQALMTFKQSAALPEDVMQRLGSTKEGQVALDVIDKARRLRSLVPKENATGGVAKLVRGALDLAWIPAPVRYSARSVLGAADPRWVKAEEVVNPRNVEAAQAFLEKRGPSAATEGLDSIANTGATKAALEEAMATSEAQAAEKSKGALTAASLKARQISRTPGGGAYQALREHTGLSTDDLNAVLRDAEHIPEMADAVKAVRVKGANTDEGMIYPLTDVLNTIADKRGMSRGALSTSPGNGALSEATTVRDTVKYAHGVNQRQSMYDQGIKDLKSSDLPKDVIESAVSTIKNIRTLGGSDKRQAAIQALYEKHPEYKTNLNAVFKEFK